MIGDRDLDFIGKVQDVLFGHSDCYPSGSLKHFCTACENLRRESLRMHNFQKCSGCACRTIVGNTKNHGGMENPGFFSIFLNF